MLPLNAMALSETLPISGILPIILNEKLLKDAILYIPPPMVPMHHDGLAQLPGTDRAYLNIDALVEYIISENRDLVILCAGWKNKFNLEDSLFAGALAEKVLKHPDYHTICDSTHASVDLVEPGKERYDELY